MSEGRVLVIAMVLVAWGSGCGGDTTGGGPGGSGGGGGGGGGAPGAGGAGTGVDITGWYKVTSDVGGPCGMPKPVAAILVPPYLFLDPRTDGFVVRTCRSQAESDCPGS